MDIVVIIMGIIAAAAGIYGFFIEHESDKKDENAEIQEKTE